MFHMVHSNFSLETILQENKHDYPKKKFQTDFDETGQDFYHDKRQVPFEDERNRPIKTEIREYFSFFFHKISAFSQQKPGSIRRQSVYKQSKPTERPPKIMITNKVNNWTVSVLV